MNNDILLEALKKIGGRIESGWSSLSGEQAANIATEAIKKWEDSSKGKWVPAPGEPAGCDFPDYVWEDSSGKETGMENTGTVHKLKTWPEYYRKIVSGEKTFEIRKNDRDFNVGDALLLMEWNPSGHSAVSPSSLEGNYTGNHIFKTVTYILKVKPEDSALFGLNSDFVIMGLAQSVPPYKEEENKCPDCGRSVLETPFCVTDDMKREKTSHTTPPYKEEVDKEKTFTLQQMIDVWDASLMWYKTNYAFERDYGKKQFPDAKNINDYFKGKFGLDIINPVPTYKEEETKKVCDCSQQFLAAHGECYACPGKHTRKAHKEEVDKATDKELDLTHQALTELYSIDAAIPIIKKYLKKIDKLKSRLESKE